jgi:hypothetical protein
MTKMKTQLISLALRPLTSLKPVTRNKTRWCSTFTMVERYNRFKQDEIFAKLCEDVEEFEVYLLSAAEERRLQTLQKSLSDLNLITKQLQVPLFTFAQTRALFDCVMQEYPTLNQYIAPDADIVHSVNFESALAKISARLEHTLTQAEKEAVVKLKLPNADAIVIDDNERELTILQKAQARLQSSSNVYPCVDWIPVGTAEVESFFSIVDSVFDSRRMSTLPIHVEEQMFLKCNRSLWVHKFG